MPPDDAFRYAFCREGVNDGSGGGVIADGPAIGEEVCLPGKEFALECGCNGKGQGEDDEQTRDEAV